MNEQILLLFLLHFAANRTRTIETLLKDSDDGQYLWEEWDGELLYQQQQQLMLLPWCSDYKSYYQNTQMFELWWTRTYVYNVCTKLWSAIHT